MRRDETPARTRLPVITYAKASERGTVLAIRLTAMPSHSQKRVRNDKTESVGLVRWVFLRGTKALTCEIRITGKRLFDVCVVPHWDVSSAIVEPYDRPASALRRHAEIASHFRRAGWVLTRQAAN
jgi:hypothetical protein